MKRIYLETFRRWLSHEWPDVLGVLILLVGLAGYVKGLSTNFPGLNVFYQEIRSELVGIGIAVLIIDKAYDLVRIREEKIR